MEWGSQLPEFGY